MWQNVTHLNCRMPTNVVACRSHCVTTEVNTRTWRGRLQVMTCSVYRPCRTEVQPTKQVFVPVTLSRTSTERQSKVCCTSKSSLSSCLVVQLCVSRRRRWAARPSRSGVDHDWVRLVERPARLAFRGSVDDIVRRCRCFVDWVVARLSSCQPAASLELDCLRPAVPATRRRTRGLCRLEQTTKHTWHHRPCRLIATAHLAAVNPTLLTADRPLYMDSRTSRQTSLKNRHQRHVTSLCYSWTKELGQDQRLYMDSRTRSRYPSWTRWR